MTTEANDPVHDDPRFQSILVSCLEALERGEVLDEARLRFEHPEFAAELGEFLDDRQRLVEMASAIRDGGGFVDPDDLEPPATLIDTGNTDRGADGVDGRTDPTAASRPSPPLDILEPTDKPGRIGLLGPYEVIDVIGRGGMGVVLEAFDPHLNRIVAIKTLAPEFAGNATARKRFAREAQAAAAVSHPHVVTIHAVEPEGDLPYLVMEFVQGQSLAQKLDKVGSLEVREILRIGAQAAQGLAAAHEQGLIHRDVKPGNVLLENGVERVKLTDFGLARATDDVAITRTGDISGTPQFMSPEQAEGRAVDVRSDLFSLGSVLYAMCTGRASFRGDTAVAVLRKVCDAEPRPIRDVNPDVPPWLVDIIDHLMAKDPEHRFQTAEEVARVLNEHLADLQNPSSGSKPKFQRRLPKPPSRWRTRTAAIVLPLLLAGLVGVLQWTGAINLLGPRSGEITVKLGNLVTDTKTELYDAEGNRIAPHGSTLPPSYFRYSELAPGRYWIKVHAAGDPNEVLHWQSVDVASGGVATIHVDEAFDTSVPQPPVTARLMEMREDTLAYDICNHSTKPIYSLWLRTPIHTDAERKRFNLGWDWGRRGIPPGECREVTIERWDAIPPFANTLATVISSVDYGDGDEWSLIDEESSQTPVPEPPTGRLIVVADGAGPEDVVSVEYHGHGPAVVGTVPTDTAAAAERPEFVLPAGNHMVRCTGRKAHGCWVRDGETTVVVMPATGEATIRERVDPVTAEWTRLGGGWVAVSGSRMGRQLDRDEAARVELRVDDVRREITLADGAGDETVPAEVDPTATPKQIDFLPTIRAIYELDGSELKLCIGGDNRPRPTAFHADVTDGGGAQSFVFRRPGAPPSGTGPTLTEDRVKELIAAAAGISNPDWATISTRPEAPTFDTLENKSLSLVLFCLKFPPAEARGEFPPNASEDFETLTEGLPKPIELATAMSVSRAKGYVSVIQPQYVTNVTVNVVGDSAHGEVTYAKEGLYRGRVGYVARRAKGNWRIEEFHLPNLRFSLERREDGLWGPMTRQVPDDGDALDQRQRERRNKLKTIGVALRNHLTAHHGFPPLQRAARVPLDGDSEDSTTVEERQEPVPAENGSDGSAPAERNADEPGPAEPDPPEADWRPGLSWRVHLLPYMDQTRLYDKFHLNEPWDSPHNVKLLAEMPDVHDTGHPTRTSLLAVVGEGTAYEGGEGLQIGTFTDGLSNIAYVVDAGLSRAVPWTKPEDLPFDEEDPIRAFGPPEFGNTFLALMCDGSTRSVPLDTAPAALRELFLRADNAVLDLEAKRSTPVPNPVAAAGAASDLLATGEWEWRVVENLSDAIPLKGTVKGGTMTDDELTLVFGMNVKGSQGNHDLWMCRRTSRDEPWSEPVGLGPEVNTEEPQTGPALSPDGLSLLFSRWYSQTLETTRTSLDDPWSKPEPFAIDRSFGAPDITASGRFLAVSSPSGDVAVARRASDDDPWPVPTSLGPEVNTDRQEKEATISDDGRILLFSRTDDGPKTHELFVSTRADTDAAWSPAVSVAESLRIENAHHARLLPDGRSFLFVGNATGVEELYLARLVKKLSGSDAAVGQVPPKRKALIALRLVADREGELASASVHVGHRFETVKSPEELAEHLGPGVENATIEGVIQVSESLKYGILESYLQPVVLRVSVPTPPDVAIPGDARPWKASGLPSAEPPFTSITLELSESRERFVLPIPPFSAPADEDIPLLPPLLVRIQQRPGNETAIRLGDTDLGTGNAALRRLDAELSKRMELLETPDDLEVVLHADADVPVSVLARALQACRLRRRSAEEWERRPTAVMIGPDAGSIEELKIDPVDPLEIDPKFEP